jgi:DNA-binding IclR family transcriptional regulator
MADTQRVQPLERGLRILTMLARFPDGMSFSQILTATDAPKASIARVLRSLREHNYISKDNGGRYQLGSAMNVFIQPQSLTEQIIALAAPHLRELCEDLGNTVMLNIYTPDGILAADKVIHPAAVSMREVGKVSLAYYSCPWGWLYLLYADKAKEKEMLQDAPKDCYYRKHRRKIKSNLDSNGYTYDDETLFKKVRRLAAPICNRSGEIVASLALGGNPLTISDKMVGKCGQALIDACQSIQTEGDL